MQGPTAVQHAGIQGHQGDGAQGSLPSLTSRSQGATRRTRTSPRVFYWLCSHQRTELHRRAYKSSKEMAPKAAVQFGVMVAGGRKTHKELNKGSQLIIQTPNS